MKTTKSLFFTDEDFIRMDTESHYIENIMIKFNIIPLNKYIITKILKEGVKYKNYNDFILYNNLIFYIDIYENLYYIEKEKFNKTIKNLFINKNTNE